MQQNAVIRQQMYDEEFMSILQSNHFFLPEVHASYFGNEGRIVVKGL